MFEKQLLHSALSRIRHSAVKVTYWDGSTITYGAEKPLVNIIFRSVKGARAMLRNFSVGFGESYMDGLIDIKGPIQELGRLISLNRSALAPLAATNVTRLRALNIRSRQQQHIQHHYDLGNDFYKMWLDKSMTYSCAYFKKDTDTLEKAQEQKRDHLLRKLQMEPNMTLLDIGSGWGELLIKAAQDYGVSGLGITLSAEQYRLSNEKAKKLGLANKIKFELINYQDLAKSGRQFDRIISVGMFEHVGRGNQNQYFKAVDKMLVDGGVSVLHTISGNRLRGGNDPWMDKYIFPGGYIPSVNEMTRGLARQGFLITDLESLRRHYALTLDEWLRRFEEHKAQAIKMFDKRFYRMWRLYLGICAGNFRYGSLDLSQIIFTKGINNTLPLTREYQYK